MTAMRNRKDMKTNQKPACLYTFQQRRKVSTHPKPGKPTKASKPPQHGHHNTDLFPRVGASGRGRSL